MPLRDQLTLIGLSALLGAQIALTLVYLTGGAV